MKTALPIIVTNYAKAFNVKVRMSGSKAYTDGKEIVIPRLDLNKEATARMAYGYLAHEASHIRYSDFKIIKRISVNFTFFSLFNVLEDARVERLIGKEFVGVWENLEFLRASFDGKLRERLKDELHPLMLILTFISYYLSVYGQGFTSQRNNTCRLLYKLRRLLNGKALFKLITLIKKAPFLANSLQVLRLSEQIGALLAQRESYRDSALMHASDLWAINGKKSLAERRFSRDDNLFAEICLNKAGKAYIGADKAFFLNLEAAKDNGSSRDDLGLVGVQLCKEGDKDKILPFVHELYPLKRSLMKAAKAYVDTRRTSRSGRECLDMRNLSRLFMYDDRVFLKKYKEEAFSTYVHILVDVSGSMQFKEQGGRTRSEIANGCAFLLANALEGIDGISCEVTFFPGRIYEYEIALRHNERASAVVSRFDQKPRGSTPLAQALWYALGRRGAFCRCRNIIVAITDGVPDSREQTERALAYAREHACEIYGFGIGSGSSSPLFTAFVEINSAQSLPRAVFDTFYRCFKHENRV